MPVYAISYDLVKEKSGSDYQPLWDELKRLAAHKVQYSMWLVNLNNTPKEVLDHFKQYVDENDRILLIELLRNRYTYKLAFAGTNKWLENNPPNSCQT